MVLQVAFDFCTAFDRKLWQTSCTRMVPLVLLDLTIAHGFNCG